MDDLKDYSFGDSPILFHTRWASTGQVSIENTHPFISPSNKVMLVHNGTMTCSQSAKSLLSFNNKNYEQLTDSEFVTDYLEYVINTHNRRPDDLKTWVNYDFSGTYTLVFLLQDSSHIHFIVKDSPLYYYEGQLASEPSMFPAYFVIPNNSCGFITKNGLYLDYRDDLIVYTKNVSYQAENKMKSVGESVLLSEIKEQAKLDYAYSKQGNDSLMDYNDGYTADLDIVACGSSYNAALLGKRYFASAGHYEVSVHYSSEYSSPKDHWTTNRIAITQSGESLDTIEVMREWKSQHLNCILITNTKDSTASQLAKTVLTLDVKKENAIAATKTFTATCLMLLRLANPSLYQDLNLNKFRDNINFLTSINIHQAVPLNWLASFKNYMFMGSGLNYPISKEASLKWKEVARINSEGLVCENFKHTSMALVDESFLGIVLCPDEYEPKYERVMNTIKQIKARGGKILGIGPSHVDLCDYFVVTPKGHLLLQPLLNNIVCQLLAYSLAVYFGYDPDNCKGHAKAITVH